MAPDSQNSAEAALALQGESLRRIVSLFEDGLEWEAWPDGDRQAFASALYPENATAFENMKAATLARHLFRGDPPDLRYLSAPSPMGEADRIRADLPGLVRLGAGRYLLAQIAEAHQQPRAARF